jgi:hypothetical protein
MGWFARVPEFFVVPLRYLPASDYHEKMPFGTETATLAVAA